MGIYGLTYSLYHPRGEGEGGGGGGDLLVSVFSSDDHSEVH